MNDNDLVFCEILDGEDKTSPLKNCIRNNYKHIRKWGKRTKTNAFRVYDRDIKEYPFVVDFYAGRFCVQFIEFEEDKEEEWQEELTEVLCSLFGVGVEDLHWKTRKRREKVEQYEKLDQSKEFFTVFEYGLQFRINLVDYLDTGLFLDHRETRNLVRTQSEGKRVLNLFAYTCSFSVHAAAGGAVYTKSVDMSNTYTEWGRENFRLNGFGERQNPIVRADCLKFLEDEIETGAKYDIIVIDPPTISRSKKMDAMFDVQIDYVYLIECALELVAKGGVIYFSTNSRKFVFDTSLFESCTIENISEKTIPLDFRNQKIHYCWKISPSG